MKRPALALVLSLCASAAAAGDGEIKAAQSTIDAQIKAFEANDNAVAYSYASPKIRQIFPTVEAFMAMVEQAYQPVWHPQSYSFGKSEEMGASIVQQVLVVGPDGKDYEATYTLEQQPDGRFLITGVSLKASNALST